ncbi:MAG: preprotein translocase subunit YajC [Clostridiales bacterium]|nr:preprotein translocase subunit YajC [Clostridiales bacterium]
MNLFLSVGDWFAQNWMLLVLIVVAVGLMVPAYLRRKKEIEERKTLNDQLVKGTKIITTAGVYGVIESVENTTDGKVVTIVTGNAKNPSTMTIHINAIGGIDNKSVVVEEATAPVEKVEKVEEKAEETAEVEEVKETKTEAKPKTTTKKSTTKKK